MSDISKANSLAKQLKDQYQERISYLQTKIQEQQKEIVQLQTEIKLLSVTKDYDV